MPQAWKGSCVCIFGMSYINTSTHKQFLFTMFWCTLVQVTSGQYVIPWTFCSIVLVPQAWNGWSLCMCILEFFSVMHYDTMNVFYINIWFISEMDQCRLSNGACCERIDRSVSTPIHRSPHVYIDMARPWSRVRHTCGWEIHGEIREDYTKR